MPKAILLAACARVCGIPARIGLADVRNHLATPHPLQLLRSVFAMHGYTELHLDGRWVKATPAFNLAQCRVFGHQQQVHPHLFELDAAFMSGDLQAEAAAPDGTDAQS